MCIQPSNLNPFEKILDLVDRFVTTIRICTDKNLSAIHDQKINKNKNLNTIWCHNRPLKFVYWIYISTDGLYFFI